LLDRFGSDFPPLNGIIHSAGLLDDGVLSEQRWERFEKVGQAKTLGAQNLHQFSKDLDLDFFLLNSSLASLIGSAGQSGYALANAFLDGLAEHRRANGLPATSVNWGPWASVGMASSSSIQDRMERQGLMPLEPTQAHQALSQVLAIGVSAAIVDADWQQMGRSFAGAYPPLLAGLLVKTIPTNGEISLLHQLRETPEAARATVISLYLQKELQQVLRMAELPQVNTGFFDLGMDSLMAVELRNRLQFACGDAFKLTNTLAFDYPTIAQLSQHLAERLSAQESIGAREKKQRASEQKLEDDEPLTTATHEETADELTKLLAVEVGNDLI
jgi:hypothetical protein